MGRQVNNRLGNGMSEQSTYDAVGQVTLRTFANIIRTTYTYDSVGNTESIRTFNGRVKTFTYDNADRLTRQQTSGASTVGYTYTYDSVGNRTYSTEWDAPTTTSYDLAGRATTMAYGATREEARGRVEALALRTLADRLDHGEEVPEVGQLFVAA